MDVGSLINNVLDNTEEFAESDQVLKAMIAESPSDFIASLLQLITTTTDRKMQKRALNYLTIPAKRCTGKFFTSIETSNIADETKANMTQILIEMLSFDEEIAKIAADVLIFYTLPSTIDKIMLTKHLVGLITPENAKSITMPFLKVLHDVSATTVMGDGAELVFHIFEFFANTQTSDDQKKMFLLIVGDLMKYIYAPENEETSLFNVLSFIWSMLNQFPKEVLNCMRSCLPNQFALIGQLPDFAENVFAALNSGDNELKVAAGLILTVRSFSFQNGKAHYFNVIIEGREQEIMTMMIDFISADEETTIITEDSFTGICAQVLTQSIMFSPEDIEETVISYSVEHIQSEIPGERFASVIMLSSSLSHSSCLDPYREIVPQFIAFALQDSSERVVDEGLKLFEGSLYRSDFFTPGEQLVGYVVSLVCSDHPSITYSAFDCLINILSKTQDEEIQTNVASSIFVHITEMEDDHSRAELLREISRYCSGLPASAALLIIPATYQLANDIISQIDSDYIPISVSPAIGFYCSVFVAAGEQASDLASDFFQFGTDLISNNFLCDGVNVISAFLKVFGSSDISVVEYASNILMEHLQTVSNKEDLQALLSLSQNVILFIDNADLLTLIMDSCLEYSTLQHDCCFDVYSLIPDVIFKIYSQNPEIIMQRMHDVFEAFYPGGIHMLSLGDDLVKMCVGLAPYFTEDPLYARALQDSLFKIGFRITRNNEETIDTDQLLILLQTARVVDPSGHILMPSLRYIANNFHSILARYGQEVSEKLAEYLPEIPPPPPPPPPPQ